MSACERLDVYLAVNSSDWKGRKTDILTLKIMNAETGCLVLYCTRWRDNGIVGKPVGKLQKTSILSSRSGSASGLNSKREWNRSASSATCHEFIKKLKNKHAKTSKTHFQYQVCVHVKVTSDSYFLFFQIQLLLNENKTMRRRANRVWIKTSNGDLLFLLNELQTSCGVFRKLSPRIPYDNKEHPEGTLPSWMLNLIIPKVRNTSDEEKHSLKAS